MPKYILTAAITLAAYSALAHEGHDHGPGLVQAQKGGVVRSLETIDLELVMDGEKILIYVFDAKNKQPIVDVSKYSASATVSFRNKKSESLNLEAQGDHWQSAYKAPKGQHRYTLLLEIKQGGHDDKIKWTVEPKRKMAHE